MFGAEDMSAFFADMGVDVVFGSNRCKGHLDAPGAMLDLGGVDVFSKDYSLTFATAQLPGLLPGSLLTADGVTYQVRSIDPEDDGQTSRAVLKKSGVAMPTPPATGIHRWGRLAILATADPTVFTLAESSDVTRPVSPGAGSFQLIIRGLQVDAARYVLAGSTLTVAEAPELADLQAWG